MRRRPSDSCFQIGIRRSILAEGVSRYIRSTQCRCKDKHTWYTYISAHLTEILHYIMMPLRSSGVMVQCCSGVTAVQLCRCKDKHTWYTYISAHLTEVLHYILMPLLTTPMQWSSTISIPSIYISGLCHQQVSYLEWKNTRDDFFCDAALFVVLLGKVT